MEKRQELSEKQEEFCRLLAEGKTTGEAERLIGFSKGYGWRLMRKEHIRRAIKVRKNPSAAERRKRRRAYSGWNSREKEKRRRRPRFSAF